MGKKHALNVLRNFHSKGKVKGFFDSSVLEPVGDKAASIDVNTAAPTKFLLACYANNTFHAQQ